MFSSSKRRSTRQAADRRRSKYYEPDTDDDFEADSDLEEIPQPVSQPQPSRKRKQNGRSNPVTRSKAKARRVVRSIGKPLRPNSATQQSTKAQGFRGPSDGKIPDWSALPIEILRSIFIYACPVTEQSTTSEEQVDRSWLFKAARVCRAFAVPALEAYYLQPAFDTSMQPHQLLHLLRQPMEQQYMDYRIKIRSLSIDVMKLAYLAHNKPPFNLADLVTLTPLLQHFEVTSRKYLPPYRVVKQVKWSFPPDELVRAMDEAGIHLRSWRWCRDMIPRTKPDDVYSLMTAAHTSKAFSYLTKLTICGFNVGDSLESFHDQDVSMKGMIDGDTSQDTAAVPPGLATSIAVLPSVRDVSFVSCDVIMNNFLLRLPRNLTRLELTNCLEITSAIMTNYLTTSGANLRELILNHNPALNLSFLQPLRLACPHLEKLEVDMQYYSEKHVTNDAEALYDEELSSDEMPTWPATLRSLKIVHAQKWSADGARNLFSSLIDAAPELQDLRSLILHTHINIPWRDRVDFRDQWTMRLNRVYRTKVKDPSPYMGSLRQYRLWTEAHAKRITVDNNTAPPTAYVRVPPHKVISDVHKYGDAEGPDTAKAPPRRSSRVVPSSQVPPTTVSASGSNSGTPHAQLAEDSDEAMGSDTNDWRRRPERFIQSKCTVVDVRIDNQRPREEQWTEGDFLDSEKSGDEDYREGNESGFDSPDGDDDGYAW